MEEPRLKPCPFCGGEAKLKAVGSTYDVFVWCGCDCGARTEKYRAETEKVDNTIKNIEDAKRMAVRAWNMRANDAVD